MTHHPTTPPLTKQDGEPVLRLPLEMGICDYQAGHPPETWEVMSNAPWASGSRADSYRNELKVTISPEALS